MKRFLLPATILLLSLFLAFFVSNLTQKSSPEEALPRPNDWFYTQRAFPNQDINHAVYREAMIQALEMKVKNKNEKTEGEWELAGPLNIGGRVSCVAMHPDNMQTFYIGAASGGIFKTTDGGNNWTPVFDDQPSLSIGDIALAPSNPEVIYAGTGEANAGGGSVSYEGLGIFRSSDGGNSWLASGLEVTGSIGRIAVHPTNPEVCYVAAMGRMFSENPQRGVFRTQDGGLNWEKVLYLNDSTGAIDITINPENPDIIYAALWERVRRPDRRNYGGPSCGIYRSENGGDTWEELTNGLPTGSNVGRIGISLAPSDPEILYAIYADQTGYFDGVFKTTDGGDNWTETNSSGLSGIYSSYGWWFGRVRVDPVNPDIVYGIGFDMYKTTNGGNTWSNISGWSVHVDQHAVNSHPNNNSFVVIGNDGGIYISQNGGNSFIHIENLPITQFYTCDVDYQNPERLYGGTQDNGTNRTMAGGLSDWSSIYGGDGFYVLVNPDNNQYVYAESQYGGLGRSTNGGSSFSSGLNGIGSDRFNWMSPLAFDPSDPSTLYFGGSKVYKSTNHAASWTAISQDLSNGAGQYNQTFGTITTLSVSPFNGDVIYAGTDDGNVWVTQSGGENWNKISDNLPLRWITRVAADPNNESTAYVTISGYRVDEYLSHIFKTNDFGESWEDISGDLPEVPVNDIIIDPDVEGAFYIATDAGVFVSWNGGENWGMLGAELPLVPVCDLTFHDGERMIVAATYGRSMYKVYVDDFVSIDEKPTTGHQLIIFPNPAVEELTIENPFVESDNMEYEIFDFRGNVVLSGEISGKEITINIRDFNTGIYSISINNQVSAVSGKFIKIK